MKSKGFTLVEVIAVILLIGLLTIMVIPSVISQVGNKSEEINDITKNMIFSATKLYLDNNNIEVTDTNCDITLQKLID